MSIEWVAGLISVAVVGATIFFIASRTEMPDWWAAVVVSSIIAKLFGSKKNGNGN